ncbi:RNA-directed DNA polymerase, eukaryota, reverse transcriptase zinc-binding domain protein, partial [Tanacetum coccineum]
MTSKSAFIPGRAITDNILLVQELLKGYNCVNGPKRCAFKIDIQKAYDTVSWIFLEDIMGKFGFPRRMIDWIMACIANSKFSICVNGERHGYFKGGRGLRQGDPISLYIFTIVMEWLNLIMNDEIKKEKQFKFHFGCRQLRITHLCFADDLIMLCHGGVESVQTIKRALDKFSAMNPNLGKCIMFCGSLDSDTKFFHLKKSVICWKSPINCFCSSINACVLGSVFLLPKTVVNDIEKLFKRFIWNNGESCKGKAKVAWAEVCKPKDQGGLGFKSLELWNKTLLVKHLWNVASRKESLWVKWINVV